MNNVSTQENLQFLPQLTCMVSYQWWNPW